jgi:hypothetical protein
MQKLAEVVAEIGRHQRRSDEQIKWAHSSANLNKGKFANQAVTAAAANG